MELLDLDKNNICLIRLVKLKLLMLILNTLKNVKLFILILIKIKIMRGIDSNK